jgi:ribosomal-protein-alanine N-acetyltransferase
MQPSAPFTIRPMEAGDISTVAAIDRLSFPNPWSASSYSLELGNKRQSFYYVLLKPEMEEGAPSGGEWRRWLRGIVGRPADSRVTGYVGFRLQSQNSEAHISTIAVHPDWRGRGLGELLLSIALEQALNLRVNVVSLEVRASNQVAQQLYRKFGFHFRGAVQAYYLDGEDAWLMAIEMGQDTYRRRLLALRQELEARLPFQQVGVGQNDGDRL